MANEHQRRLMQEALDEQLSAEALQELYDQLDESPGEQDTFGRLKRTDRLLRTAPMERAPQTLALRIMARLAEGLQPHLLKRTSGLALALGLALVTALLLPLLAVVSWLILNALGSVAIMNTVIQQIIDVLAAIMSALSSLVNGARQLLETYPEAPFALALIPIALFSLLRFSARSRRDE